MPELPENSVFIETRAQWRTWLETHHTRAEGVWLIYNKKASGKPTVPYAEQVEEALCFGWVDSKGNKLDEERTMLYFAPRKAGSGWARPNKERVERLIAQGLMAPAGLTKIEAARLDGSWEKLDDVEDLVVPEDLAAEFARYPNAATHFEAFPRSAKRAILEWLVQAKRTETRQKRIEETARLANENLRANQWQPPTK